MKRTKLVYIIGSVIIGLISVLGVYLTLMATGVLSLQQRKIIVASASAEKEYDGTPLTCLDWKLLDGNLKEGHSLNVKVSGEGIDAGQYVNHISVEVIDSVGANVTSDYVIETKPGSLTIDKRVITLTSGSAEKVYDGEVLKCDEITFSDGALVRGHFLVNEALSEITSVGVCQNEFVSTVRALDGTDVTKNYRISYDYGTLEIKPRTIMITTATDTFGYDGGVHFNHNYTLSENTPIVDGQTLDVSMNLYVTDVGTFKNTVEGFVVTGVLGEDVSENYVLQELLGEITVLPREITLLSGSEERYYDGTPLTCETLEIVEGSLADGHELEFDFLSSITYATENRQGILNDFVVEVKEKAGGKTVTENYDINKIFGTINILPVGLTITSDAGTKVYDGKELKVETYALEGELKKDDVLEVDFTQSIKDVGSKLNEFTYVIKNSDGEELVGAYDVKCVFLELSVSKRPVTIETGSHATVYDGTAKTKEEYAIIEGTLAEGQTEFVNDWSSIKDVGSIQNDFEIVIKDSEEVDVTANYEITKKLGELLVTKRPVTIETENYIETYDGTEKTHKNYSITDGSIAENQIEKLSNWTTIKDAGEKDNDFSIVILDANLEDVTQNYQIEKILGKLVIKKRHVTFESEDNTTVYDGEEKFHKQYSIVEGSLVDGHVETADWWNSITNVGTVNNDFTITIKDADGYYVTSNYEIEKVLGELVVTKRPVSFKSESKSFDYDGTEKRHEEYSIIEGSLVQGHVETADWWSSITNVGSTSNDFRITIKDSNGTDVTSNYQIEKKLGLLTVGKRSIIFESESQSFVYDGTEKTHKIQSIYSGELVSGHSATADAWSSITNVGTVNNDFTITIKDASGADVTSNYEVREILGRLTVTARPIAFKSESMTFVYDGTEKSHEVYSIEDGTLADGHEVTVDAWSSITDVRTTNNNFRVIIKNSDGDNVTANYSVNKNLGYLSVIQRTITVETGSYTSVYDGTVKEFWSYQFIEGSLVLDHYEEVGGFSTITEVGSVNNDFTMVIKNTNGDDVTANYKIIKRLGKLSVEKRPLAIRSATAEKVYDGIMLKGCEINADGYTDGYKVVSITALVDGHVLSCAVDGEILNVGSKNNTVSEVIIYAYVNGEEINVTRNYEIKISEGTLTITEPNTNDRTDTGSEDDVLDENVVCAEIYSEKDGAVYLRWKSYGDYNYTINWDETAEYTVKIDDTYSMNYLPSILLDKAGYSSYSVKLKSYVGRYILPYYMGMETSDYRIQKSDVHYSGDTSKEYGLYFYDFDYLKSGKEGFRGVNLGAYNDLASDYEGYVISKYIYVPADTKTEMEKIIKEAGISANDQDVIAKVANYISKSATYNKNYDRALDQSTDVAISFLNEYKEGVCSHYATAATVMFRTLGIPARYVSGFSAKAVANKWVEIKGSSAHAWVEVYVSGVGWVMVEVTGSSNSNSGGSSNNGNSSNNKIAIRAGSKYVKYLGDNSVEAEDTIIVNDKIQDLLNKGYTYTVNVEGSLSTPGKCNSIVKDFYLTKDDEVIYRYENYTEVYNNGEFDFVFYNGTLQLYKQKLEISSNDYTKVYDGTPLIPDEFGWSYTGTLENGHRIGNISFIKSIINVGSVGNDFLVQIIDEDGNDVSDLYYVKKTIGQLTIKAREITITAGSAEKSYDGTPLTCSEYEVTSTQNPNSPLVLGDELTCQTVGSIIKKGRATNDIDMESVVILDMAGNDVTKNYSIKLVSGTLKVLK